MMTASHGCRKKGRDRARAILKAPKHVNPKQGSLHSRSQREMRPGVYLLMRVELSGSGFCAACTPQIVSAPCVKKMHQHCKARGFFQS